LEGEGMGSEGFENTEKGVEAACGEEQLEAWLAAENGVDSPANGLPTGFEASAGGAGAASLAGDGVRFRRAKGF
jgi:hypothetical protein